MHIWRKIAKKFGKQHRNNSWIRQTKKKELKKKKEKKINIIMSWRK